MKTVTKQSEPRMFGIEKPATTGSAATGRTKLPNSLDKVSESQIGSDRRKMATEKKGMPSQILSVSEPLDFSAGKLRSKEKIQGGKSHY